MAGPLAQPPPGHETLLGRIDHLPRERTHLLPALLEVQHELGWLPDWAIEYVGAHLRVPKSEAYGAASSFPELRLEAPPARVVRICRGAACHIAGADHLRAEIPDAEAADCLFICALAPAAEADGRLIGRATAKALAPAHN